MMTNFFGCFPDCETEFEQIQEQEQERQTRMYASIKNGYTQADKFQMRSKNIPANQTYSFRFSSSEKWHLNSGQTIQSVHYQQRESDMRRIPNSSQRMKKTIQVPRHQQTYLGDHDKPSLKTARSCQRIPIFAFSSRKQCYNPKIKIESNPIKQGKQVLSQPLLLKDQEELYSKSYNSNSKILQKVKSCTSCHFCSPPTSPRQIKFGRLQNQPIQAVPLPSNDLSIQMEQEDDTRRVSIIGQLEEMLDNDEIKTPRQKSKTKMQLQKRNDDANVSQPLSMHASNTFTMQGNTPQFRQYQYANFTNYVANKFISRPQTQQIRWT